MPERDATFCRIFAEFGNAEEAAVKAGYPKDRALGEGLKLLEDRAVVSKVRQLIKKNKWQDHTAHALAGLRRIALGSPDIPVWVNKNGIPGGIDSFCVSEIKVTEKGTEIKFYDRLKALEMLLKWDGEKGGTDQRTELYSAVMKSAEAVFKGGTEQ